VEVSEEDGLWERWEDAVSRDGLDLFQVQNWKTAARSTTLEEEDQGGHSLTMVKAPQKKRRKRKKKRRRRRLYEGALVAM
jgi:hypothetical protein